jgi:hypothetical protein
MSTRYSRNVTEGGKWRIRIKINLQNAALKETVYLKTRDKNEWTIEVGNLFPKLSV